MSKYKFDEIVSHLQVSGYVYPGSQIYGGLSNAWDYGPLGVELKKKVSHRSRAVAKLCEYLLNK